VVFARSLLRKLGGKDEATRRDLLAKLGFADRDSLKKLRQRESAVLDDLRVIDMYEAAIRHDLKVYRERTGNWVQKFSATEEANLFVAAQFSRYTDVEQFLDENFRSPPALPIRNAGSKETP